jgi:hypothetical protein
MGAEDIGEKTYFRYRMPQRMQKEETQPTLRLRQNRLGTVTA